MMAINPVGTKIYLQPSEMILNAIHDIGALQKSQMIMCDTPRGLVGYKITMYGEEMEYRFNVEDIGSRCSRVTIELEAKKPNERLVDNEFALLDYALLDKAKIDYSEQDEWDKRIRAEREKPSDGNM